MNRFTDWCAFVGAWLLFAGPIYQAESELDTEAREGEEFLESARAVEVPPDPSFWWWLLPPVGFYLHRRQNQEVRRRVRAILTPEQLEQYVRFSQKAMGWMLVGGGAGLIAIRETWSLCHLEGWPGFVFWVLIVVVGYASIAFTMIGARRRDRILGVELAHPAANDTSA